MVGNVTTISNYDDGIDKSSIYQKSEPDNSDESLFLEERLTEISDEQGFLGNFWNGVKEVTNLGVSKSDCESKLEQFNNGEISFEEAIEYIEGYNIKQKNISELEANILTGVGAITVATAAASTGPIGWGLAIAKGAPVGAILKTSIKTVDRATNNVEDDEINLKQMSKDAISGALTGSTSAVSSGVAIGIKEGNAFLSITNGTKCGAICGAASGAVTYLTDVAFDDTEFDASAMASSTLTSSAVSAVAGAIVGGGLFGSAKISGNIGNTASKNLVQTIAKDSTSSSVRKIVAQGERNVIAA